MDRRSSLVLLAVFGIGVFLAGLELMITAVALPSILADLVAANGTSAWIELRKASWIINGYLLVYILTMPLAGRLADLWGVRRLFFGAIVTFALGSLLAGMAQDLDQLIAARLVQAVGGGVLVPVGTAAAAHLFDGHGRPRALGVVGALTFLGMAAGPFLGAAILATVHPEEALIAAGLANSTPAEFIAPAWRWIFYVNVPIAVCALVLAWAASAGWETPRRPGRIDLAGAAVFGIALAAGLLGLTLLGAREIADTALPPATVSAALAVLALVATLLAVVRAARARDPFLDVRLFRDRAFSAAGLVSLLTGYAFATAIIGAAVFVDRVLYGGPDDQRLALGALAGATAVGALLSGFAVRVASFRIVTLVGLALSVAGLAAMSRWTPLTTVAEAALALGAFGLGFGLSVTPRSTAALEAAGRAAFGAASSVVTVARMLGMAIGLAVLTAYGSTTIDRLSTEVYATTDAYLAYIPENLRDRPLRDALVVEALETWASREAASIMVGLFLVAALVTAAAVPPAIALGASTRRQPRPERMLAADGSPTPASSSDRTTGRTGEPVAGQRLPASSGGPGQVRVAAMVDGALLEIEGDTALKRLPELLGQPDGAVWVDLARPSPGQVEAVGAALGLHHLIVEDVLEGNQRAKIETTDGVVHIVLFALDRSEEVSINEIDLVLGSGYVLSVHDPSWDPRASNHLSSGLATIMANGPDHLLWAIGDDIVDGYFPYADRLGDAIDEVQDAVLTKATPDTLERLFALKRELIEVRRAASPTREVFNQLTNRDLALIDPDELVYFRDIYDHVIRLSDELDNYRELASSTLDVYLTQVNNNLSVIVKRLTGVTVVVAGIGAVAGIFGMSEAGTALAGTAAAGFWVVAGTTIVAAAGAVVVLRRIGWI